MRILSSRCSTRSTRRTFTRWQKIVQTETHQRGYPGVGTRHQRHHHRVEGNRQRAAEISPRRPPKKLLLQTSTPLRFLISSATRSRSPSMTKNVPKSSTCGAILMRLSLSPLRKRSRTRSSAVSTSRARLKTQGDLAHDSKENKNLLIPMSRAQALILLLVHANNKMMAAAARRRGRARAAFTRVLPPGGAVVVVPLDGVPLPDLASSRAFLRFGEG